MPELESLMYSDDRVGPWKMYIYEPGTKWHRGGQWFSKSVKYPDEEITVADALDRCTVAMGDHREVRVCDGGDKLVFHCIGHKILYGAKFWEEVI